MSLSDAVFWVLVFIPLWALPFGVSGAALGSTRWRHRRAQQTTTLVRNPTATPARCEASSRSNRIQWTVAGRPRPSVQ